MAVFGQFLEGFDEFLFEIKNWFGCTDNLRKREAQIFKNLEFARVLLNKAIQDSHGMQGKFTDQEKGQQEFSALLHELDIVQASSSLNPNYVDKQ